MLKTIMSAGLALTVAAGASFATANDAEARGRGYGYRGGGLVAGTIIGLGIAGAYAASRDRCYAGHQRCDVVGQRCFYNRYGEYVCRDDVRCYRPTVCD